MYKTVYRASYGKLTVRERSYTLTLNEPKYRESDSVPVPAERIQPRRAGDPLPTFVQQYVSEHPKTDLVDRLVKAS